MRKNRIDTKQQRACFAHKLRQDVEDAIGKWCNCKCTIESNLIDLFVQVRFYQNVRVCTIARIAQVCDKFADDYEWCEHGEIIKFGNGDLAVRIPVYYTLDKDDRD